MTAIYKMILLLLMMAIVCFSFPTSAYSWLFYSKPEFRGRVIDAETKQPIEGAVVVVLYKKEPMIGGPGGPSPYVFEAKETLTDKNGEFYFPSHRTIIGPLSRNDRAEFIFFKPGYKAISDFDMIEGVKISKERYFAIEKDMVGKEGEIEEIDDWETLHTYKGPLGIVELKRGEHDPSTPTDYRSEKLPLLFKALNEDRRNRGYKGELK